MTNTPWSDGANCNIDPYVGAPFVKQFQLKVIEAGMKRVTLEGKADCALGKYNTMQICLWDHHPREERRVLSTDTKPTVFGGYDYIAASFRLCSLPSCCGVLVSHDSSVVPAWRRKGIASLMQEMKFWLGNQLQVGKMIATVDANNLAEAALLRKFGWASGPPFTNHRSGTSLIIWEKIFKAKGL